MPFELELLDAAGGTGLVDHHAVEGHGFAQIDLEPGLMGAAVGGPAGGVVVVEGLVGAVVGIFWCTFDAVAFLPAASDDERMLIGAIVAGGLVQFEHDDGVDLLPVFGIDGDLDAPRRSA